MWPSADALPLTAPQRNALRRLVRGRNTAQKMVLRAHIVLRCAQGLANHAMARELGVNRKTVILWRKRFAQSGLDGLRDRTRPGRKPTLSAEFVQCFGPSGGPNSVQLDAITAPSRAARSGHAGMVGSKSLTRSPPLRLHRHTVTPLRCRRCRPPGATVDPRDPCVGRPIDRAQACRPPGALLRAG